MVYTRQRLLDCVSRICKASLGHLRFGIVALILTILTFTGGLAGFTGSLRADHLEQAYAIAPDRPAITIRGNACVLDGDTLVLGAQQNRGRCTDGMIIHLSGIDAPELTQKCRDAFHVVIACGRYARAHLIINTRNQQVHCKVRKSKKPRHYLGTCEASGKNLNQLMIRDGMALAASHGYVTYNHLEIRARLAKKGIWRLSFTAPWIWRRNNT